MRRGRDGASQKSPLSYCPVLVPSKRSFDRSPSPRTVLGTNGHSTTPNRGANTFDVVSAIRTFKLFETAPEELIDLIVARMRSRLVENGDEICREGEDAKAMYWIIRGSVAVVSRDGESRFAELESGHFFGYLSYAESLCFTLTNPGRLEYYSRCRVLQV